MKKSKQFLGKRQPGTQDGELPGEAGEGQAEGAGKAEGSDDEYSEDLFDGVADNNDQMADVDVNEEEAEDGEHLDDDEGGEDEGDSQEGEGAGDEDGYDMETDFV